MKKILLIALVLFLSTPVEAAIGDKTTVTETTQLYTMASPSPQAVTATVNPGTSVTIMRTQCGQSFVIVEETFEAGWISNRHLDLGQADHLADDRAREECDERARLKDRTLLDLLTDHGPGIVRGVAAESETTNSSRWSTESISDPMTNKTTKYARSPATENLTPLPFPYQDVRSKLVIAGDAESEWAYFWFTEAPNLTDTKLEDGRNIITARVRFGDNNTVENIRLIQLWGEPVLHVSYAKDFIRRCRSGSYSTVTIQLVWYGGRAVFKYDLDGANGE